MSIFTPLALVLALSLWAAPAAEAATPVATAKEDAVRKINLSGRQRMLSQRIAQAACHATIGVNADEAGRRLAEARQLFGETLTALRRGDPGMGILAEDEASVLSALNEVDGLWGDFSAAANQAATDRGAFDTVAGQNVDLLKRSDDVVKALVAAKGAGTVSADLAVTIDVAGRQRMLGQRIAKGACFVALGIDGAATELAAAIALFEASHEALIVGDLEAGIVPAPMADILNRLAAVDSIWTGVRDIALRAGGGETPSNDDLSRLSEAMDDLLREMNAAVTLYEDG